MSPTRDGLAAQPTLLFPKPGPSCTSAVIDGVARRLEQGDVSHIVVASISGRTALQLARRLKRSELSIVCVTGGPSWGLFPEYDRRRLSASTRGELEKLGVALVDRAISSFGDTVDYGAARFGFLPPSWVVAETLTSVGGYGLKTAVEATLMATDAGALPAFTEVLAVAGTNRGADTAAIVTSTYSASFFGLDQNRRLQVKEILAMPRNKTWYTSIAFADWRVDERMRRPKRARQSS